MNCGYEQLKRHRRANLATANTVGASGFRVTEKIARTRRDVRELIALGFDWLLPATINDSALGTSHACPRRSEAGPAAYCAHRTVGASRLLTSNANTLLATMRVTVQCAQTGNSPSRNERALAPVSKPKRRSM